MSFTWNLEFRDLMQILLGMNPQYGQNLLHVVALAGKGRRLDLLLLLLQMPKSRGTQLGLPVRNTWGSKRSPSSAPTLQARHESWVQKHWAPVSPVCGGKWLPTGTYLQWHGGYGNPHTSWVPSLGVVFCCGLLARGILPIFGEISVSSLSRCCLIP